MCYLIILLSLVVTPLERAVLVDYVDVAEVNHIYDNTGSVVLDQVIWWERNNEGGFDVVAWRLLKSRLPPVKNSKFKHPKGDHLDAPPVGEWVGEHATPRRVFGRYVSSWLDGRVMRQVISKHHRETWTTHDPEVEHREILSQSKRRKLTSRWK